jgi:hypothetical protein
MVDLEPGMHVLALNSGSSSLKFGLSRAGSPSGQAITAPTEHRSLESIRSLARAMPRTPPRATAWPDRRRFWRRQS